MPGCSPSRPAPLRASPPPLPRCSFEKYGGLSASLRTLLDAPPDVDMDEYQQRSRVQVGAGFWVLGAAFQCCAVLRQRQRQRQRQQSWRGCSHNPPNNRQRLLPACPALLPCPAWQVGDSTVAFRPEWDRHRLTPRHTAYLRVAEGCNHACTFCAIPGFRWVAGWLAGWAAAAASVVACRYSLVLWLLLLVAAKLRGAVFWGLHSSADNGKVEKNSPVAGRQAPAFPAASTPALLPQASKRSCSSSRCITWLLFPWRRAAHSPH